MSQNRTFDFVAPRKTELLNRQQFKVAPTGIHAGYNVVIDTGTVGAADTIKIVNAPDLTSVAVSRQGVRIEESGPDPISSLSVTTADGSNPRIDIVVIQHIFSSSNNPATYAVIAGTPAASPVPPAVPTDAVVLAEVSVATSAASITNDNIIRRAKELASLNTPGTSRLTNVENTTHAPVADITALKAIPPEERFDNQTILVRDDGTTVANFYRFDDASTDTADGLNVVIPNAFSLGTAGRWLRFSVPDTVWVRKSSEFTDLQSALSDFENSPRATGILIYDSTISLSGDVTTSKPLRIVSSGSGVQIALASNIWTIDNSNVVFEGVGLNRSGTQTGKIKILADTLDVSLEWKNKDGVVIIDTSTAAAGGVIEIDSGSGERITFRFIDCQLKRSTTAGNTLLNLDGTSALYVVIFDNSHDVESIDGLKLITHPVTAGTMELHLRNYSLIIAEDFGAVSADNRIFLDGTSLLTGGTIVFVDFTEVSGHCHYTKKYEDLAPSLVDVGIAIAFSAGRKLTVSPKGNSTAYTTPVSGSVVPGGALSNKLVEGISPADEAITVVCVLIDVDIGASGLWLAVGTDTIFRNFRFSVKGTAASTAIVLNGSARSLIENIFIQMTADVGIIANAIKISGENARAVNCRFFGTNNGRVTSAFRADGLASSPFEQPVFVNCKVSSGWDSEGFLLTEGGRAERCYSLADKNISSGQCFNLDTRAEALSCFAGIFGAEAASGFDGFSLGISCKLVNCTAKGDDTASAQKMVNGVVVNSPAEHVSITGCEIFECTTDGVEIAAGVNRVTIANCHIYDNTTTGIDDNGANSVFGNNVVEGNGTNLAIAGSSNSTGTTIVA